MMMPSMRLAGVEYEAVPAGVRRGQGCPWWPHDDDDVIVMINDYDDDDDHWSIGPLVHWSIGPLDL